MAIALITGESSFAFTLTAIAPGSMRGGSSIGFDLSGTLHGCRAYRGCSENDYAFSSAEATAGAACSGPSYAQCGVDDYEYATLS